MGFRLGLPGEADKSQQLFSVLLQHPQAQSIACGLESMQLQTPVMTTLHPSSRKQLLLQLLNKRNRAQNPISKGFTLIELLVVIVILGVLGGVGYQAYVNQLGRANQAVAQNTATAIAKNCAALLVTGDEATFDADQSLSGDVSTTNGTTCDLGADWTVTAGTGTNLRTSSSSVTDPEGIAVPGDIGGTPAPAPAP